MTELDSLLQQACAVRRRQELNAFDRLPGAEAAAPVVLPQVRPARRARVAAAILAACLLFATAACAVWPTVALKIRQGKAWLMTDGGGEETFRQFRFTTLPEGCELRWNPAEGYYSCTVRQGGVDFTVVQYPLDHQAMIVGDYPDGRVTQEDLEGIDRDFGLVSSAADLTETLLETHTVVSWAADNSYFVVLNHTWSDYAGMCAILQGIRS